MHNKTFSIGETYLNACVGDNGFADDRTYADGFATAVEKLVGAAIRREVLVDTVIYPICFCARHYIELFLKYNVRKISNIKKLLLIQNMRKPMICRFYGMSLKNSAKKLTLDLWISCTK
ncbi:hypothetical protein [Chromobacterium violaceum]|uniref:hypothetical protein n=1 Tax=Chromobacterium violaceum TaxID=536 RepID=UPI001B33A0E4|nr:hypothetical protein [Chromobacterium violaceum]MBP4047461.1 hypothetical protein [Chromobacterium violaceum]